MLQKNRSASFRLADVIYILMMTLPFAAAMVIKVLTKPPSEGVQIAGAQIYFTIPMPLQSLPISESQVNSLFVMIVILGACLYLSHGIRAGVETKRQMAAEWAVEKTVSLVRENMGDDKYFGGFPPFIGAVMVLSVLSSLLSLMGLFPPTSDMNIVGGWALLVFILITYYKLKCGPVKYLKSFAEPVAVLTPINLISEVATPVSMAFRHYGNVLSGSVISVLLAMALQGLSVLLLGWLPGALGEFPLFQIGIPAVLSLYFDLFSGCLQAFIFAMLSMLYISGGFAVDEYERIKALKKQTANK